MCVLGVFFFFSPIVKGPRGRVAPFRAHPTIALPKTRCAEGCCHSDEGRYLDPTFGERRGFVPSARSISNPPYLNFFIPRFGTTPLEDGLRYVGGDDAAQERTWDEKAPVGEDLVVERAVFGSPPPAAQIIAPLFHPFILLLGVH